MKKTAISILALCACLAAEAQNVNPVVEVTNSYSGALGDFQKMSVPMAVPDSLLQFGYSFDYSVFDNPYHGAYEFSPYSVKVTPASSAYRGGKLYLRAGAGWTLNPELEFACNLRQKENFSLNLFADAHGYWGKYKSVGSDLLPDGGLYSGMDLAEKAGLDGRYHFKGSTLGFVVGEEGILSSDNTGTGSYLGGFARARLSSDDATGSFFLYDISLGYRFGYETSAAETAHNVNFSGTVGPVLNTKYRFLVDFYLLDEYRAGSNLFAAGATPRAKFVLGKFDVSAGVKIGWNGSGLSFAPDVHASAGLLDNKLTFYADLTGGDRLYGLYELKTLNHFYNSAYGESFIGSTSFDARGGIRGHFGPFSYDFRGGYAIENEAPVFNEYVVSREHYRLLYADASLGWSTERLQIDAAGRFAKASFDSDYLGYGLPAVSGSARVIYNWNRRIYAGVWFKGETSRASADSSVPGWVDLGLSLEYKVSRKLGVWAEAGNILNSDVRKTLTHIQNGPYLTAGICLKF